MNEDKIDINPDTLIVSNEKMIRWCDINIELYSLEDTELGKEIVKDLKDLREVYIKKNNK